MRAPPSCSPLAAPLLSTFLTGPSLSSSAGAALYDTNKRIEASYPRDVSEAMTVTVDGRLSDQQLRRLQRRISGIDGIAGGSPFVRASKDVAYANFAADEKALSRRTQDAVDEIRANGAPGDARLLVSGNTARFIDQKQSLADHMPLLIAILSLTTFVLLFMLTGSVILPIKTLLMNALTLAATLGIIVLGFQEGCSRARSTTPARTPSR